MIAVLLPTYNFTFSYTSHDCRGLFVGICVEKESCGKPTKTTTQPTRIQQAKRPKRRSVSIIETAGLPHISQLRIHATRRPGGIQRNRRGMSA